MTSTPSAAAVLLSGGLDSTTLLFYVVNTLKRSPVHTISFDYGQRHNRELRCAAWQAARAGVTAHDVVDLGFLGPMLKNASALVEDGADVPDLDELDRDQLDQPPTYVPNRNMMLLSIAAACAEARGVRDVFYGAQAMDEYGYWDCTAAFLDRINAVLSLNRRDSVTIHAPFVNLKKTDVLKIGLELGVDYSQTWSCYRGGKIACGTCPTCVERLSAFREVGVKDPLPYRQ